MGGFACRSIFPLTHLRLLLGGGGQQGGSFACVTLLLLTEASAAMNEPLNVIRRVRQEQVRMFTPFACCSSCGARECHAHTWKLLSTILRPSLVCGYPLLLASQVITDRLTGIKEQAHAMRACEWANSKLVTDVGNRHLAETKKIAAELEQENREMMLLRKSRMREFLKAEAEVFEQQVCSAASHLRCCLQALTTTTRHHWQQCALSEKRCLHSILSPS